MLIAGITRSVVGIKRSHEALVSHLIPQARVGGGTNSGGFC